MSIATSLDDDYSISTIPVAKQIRIEIDGVTVANSTNAILYKEANLKPVYYFPRDDVRMDLFYPTDHKTHCPFKGNASYWTIDINGKKFEDAVWSYETPIEEAKQIKHHVAFYLDILGATYDEGRDFKTINDNKKAENRHIVDWLLREGWKSEDPEDLTKMLGLALNDMDIPVKRLNLIIRTLHPLLIGHGYRWEVSEDSVLSFPIKNAALENPVFLDSPLVPIFNGSGGIRRRLEGDSPILDYPILNDMVEMGMTDYVAMPLQFSNGQINAITLATDVEGGFSTAHLGHIHEILPTLARFYEVHEARNASHSLLQTYLGKGTGKRVLDGLIKRGDSESIDAVVWFCDLRESSTIAKEIPRDEFVELLNDFFECMVDPIVENNGEVLRFIGDAVLAIFPVDTTKPDHQKQVCEEAVLAAFTAQQNVLEYNATRQLEGLRTIDFGIGLHLGQVTYGNIGVPDRLEFTVIGSAANEAARIESLTKVVHEQILLSKNFCQSFPAKTRSLGTHQLRGIEAQEVFAPIAPKK